MLLTAMLSAIITAAGPLVLKKLIDDGIALGRHDVVAAMALAIAGLACLDAVFAYIQTWLSARAGQGIIYDLRTEVYDHVQRQPIAFFARAQTGALVSRLSTDVVGAQQAVTSLLSQTASTLLTLTFVLATMVYLSWQLTVAALMLIPIFLVPGKLIGRRLQRLTRQRMQGNAELTSLMNERFNVAGATLAKLYGRADEELGRFAGQAAHLRDVNVAAHLTGRMLAIIVALLGGLATAVIYGFGGNLAIDGALQVGTLIAVMTLLLRLFGPINQLSTVQADVMTALISFERVFELLNLRPLVNERGDAKTLRPPGPGAPGIEFESVYFRYPSAGAVSIASLESSERKQRTETGWVLDDVSLRIPAGRLVALVGPSGAGKSTLTHLVSRLYDPTAGIVRIAGHDLRDVTFRSLHDTVGVVTQDAHLFHDTLRANLLYARPDASELELIEACEAARIWHRIAAMPDGLDTIVGERGYRLSGGEKQRISLARLMLKSPPVVILDEATAHLDSESEMEVQRALRTALHGRTSLVIAHRLSTIRDADRIVVVDGGTVRESGTHDELLAGRGVYATLYRTQFAGHP